MSMSGLRKSSSRLVGMSRVGWRRSDVTVAYPDGAILHYDADVDAFSEQTSGTHTFNHAVLAPQYQRNADGSYANVGAKPAVDVFGGEKWLRSCGAITNLFGGDTSIARSVTLTEQAYTLQVFGAGTVSCSYGSASVGTPLTFMATAGATLFTPAGATYWMLTATAYPVPYVPPGVTQPASNATTTNGSWFTLPDGSPLWHALDGQADGVKLVTQPLSISSWGTGSATINDSTSFTTTGTNGYVFKNLGLTAGVRYKGTIGGTVSGGTISVRDLGYSTTYKDGFGSFVFTAIDAGILIRITGASGLVASGLTLSIQRIQPQPLTLATRVRMGVLYNEVFVGNHSIIDTSGSTWLHRFGDRDYAYIVRAYDGKTSVSAPILNWPRNSIIRRVTQVNTAGTQFRVGYMIEGTHTAIQWSSWKAFDGSFNPSTLYRLMLGYDNAYPMWFNKITAWKEQVTDAEILEAMA